MGYKFIGDKGKFTLKQPDMSSYMYFPLCNDGGIKSAITPELGGDMKKDQNTFALQPVSSEELHNSRVSRNFWVKVEGTLWSLTGQSASQHLLKRTPEQETTALEAGFLYQKVTRQASKLTLKSEMTTYVPSNNDPVELTEFKLTNTGDQPLRIEPTAAIPLYGRSADNYRDHRHVTSLLNRMASSSQGLWVNPTLSFDERGHQVNQYHYGVFGKAQHDNGQSVDIIGLIPTVETFIGEGGHQDWPLSLLDRDPVMDPIGTSVDGYEVMGGLCFETTTIEPGESISFYLGIFIESAESLSSDGRSVGQAMKQWADTYGNHEGFTKALEATKKHWEEKVSVVKLETDNHSFDQWMQWVNIQPILRRIYGCSFLPHHDYGRGGRGWRDLWQDSLALLLMEPQDVRFLLLNNYAGVRIDGTNATIIGDQPGEFVADRNNISRTWMDHGAWPWLTTKEYIHQSGDLDFLFEEQTYFKDALTARSTKRDDLWQASQGNDLLTSKGDVYKGTILEHLIVQNLSIFYHVGDHNVLKLEDADWNDALDMASERGESVAFTALYTSNLREITEMLQEIKTRKNMETIVLAKEILVLLQAVDNKSIEAKHEQLAKYFTEVGHRISGDKVKVDIDDLCASIEEKVTWMTLHLQKEAFISNKEGYQWFNSYYDNHGRPVEGDHDLGTRMMLTGQVFSLMGNIATDQQASAVVKTAKHYLQDKAIGGYRLNTNFHEVKSDLGRGFGFAYGHKENGAMFSHMAIMYGNALYKRGFINEGYELISDMFNHCYDFDQARIYPSVPEYINEGGRGMYTYLTGSASWLLYTVVTEMFGCKGHYGDLILAPKLHTSQFKEGKASIDFLFHGNPLKVEYTLTKGQSLADQASNKTMVYKMGSIVSDAIQIEAESNDGYIILSRASVEAVQKASGTLEVAITLTDCNN